MFIPVNMAAEQLIQDFLLDDETEVPTTAEQRWRAVVRHLLRVRSLQRLWGVLGGFLRTQFPASLKDRLHEVYP